MITKIENKFAEKCFDAVLSNRYKFYSIENFGKIFKTYGLVEINVNPRYNGELDDLNTVFWNVRISIELSAQKFINNCR